MMRDLRSVKILGERNTGTNFLAEFLNASFDVAPFPNAGPLSAKQRQYLRLAEPRKARRDELREAIWDENYFAELPRNGGWKHAAATPEFVERFARPQGCLVICLVRHRASWLFSMHRNPFHASSFVRSAFGDFIRSPWMARPRDGLENRLLSSPLDLLRLKTESYVRLGQSHARSLILRYEDVLLDPDRAMARLAKYLRPTQHHPILPGKSSRPFLREHSSLEDFIRKARSASYSMLSGDDLEFVREALGSSELVRLYPVGE